MERISCRDEKLMVGSTIIQSVASTAEEFRSEFLNNSNGTISQSGWASAHPPHPAHLAPRPLSLSSTCSSPCLSTGTYPSPSPTNTNGSFTFSKSDIMKNYHHSLIPRTPRNGNGNENGWGIGFPYPSHSPINAGSFSFSNSDQNNYVKAMQGKKNPNKSKLGYLHFSQNDICIVRESNPGRPRGRRAFYH